MEHIQLKVENAVAIVTINRPPANAMAQAVLQEIDEVFHLIAQNDEARVVLLHGEGRFFSAGADIKEFLQVASAEEFASHAANTQSFFENIEKFEKPVIAAIHGAALGGGLELAMSCHIRFVTHTAKLGLPELQLGLIPGFGGTQRLPKYVGTAKAAEMMFSSEPITGDEAVRIGLANAAFEDSILLEEALKFSEKIALKSPIALKATIQMLNYSKHEAFYEGMKQEAIAFGNVFESEDAKEGITAFVEKRQPVFKGK